MQLIYGFRGSQPERLQRHIDECGEQFELHTFHRWHSDQGTARWLGAFRSRLEGTAATAPMPASLRIRQTRAGHGFNAVKPAVRAAVSDAFRNGARTIAVLAAWNDDVTKLRTYLSREGLYPRHVGSDDFEDARHDIEQLPLLADPQTVALRAVDRIVALAPTLESGLVTQVTRRLLPARVNTGGNCGEDAERLLRALRPIYENGPAEYINSIVAALDACVVQGHHLSRIDAVRALRATAEASRTASPDLEGVLRLYAGRIVAAAHAAPRHERGLFVMTVHQAKGKEFDAVVIANMTLRHFPDTDESRRIFYVAITRASKRWLVIVPDERESPLVRHLRG